MESVVREGEVLADKYRVDKILGAGGMGYVVACLHLHLQQKVALKFLHPNMLQNPEVVGRFLREAQAAVQIRSEHVARVSDVGKLADGAPYMVMEYLEGEDLKHVLASKGPLPVAQAIDFLLQACEALAEAHVLGIVHRDLKPENLFLTHKADGRACVKVLDFGISKVSMASSGVNNLTGTSAMLGTPYYMAPEQLTSTRSVDARADIWALGVVLYELIACALPFNGETLAELCIHIVQEQPIPLTSLDPNVPPGVWSVVARCLQKDREARFANVAEVAVALAPYGTASSRLSTDTISRIIPTQSGGPVAVAGELPVPVSKERTDTVAVGQTRVVTGHTAWGQTNASSLPKSRKAPWLFGASIGIVVLAFAGWYLRSSVLATRGGELGVGSNSAAVATTSLALAPANVALAPVQPTAQVLVQPIPSSVASAVDALPSTRVPDVREPPGAVHGAAPVVQPNRIRPPDPPKRSGGAAAEPRANPEDLIDDRR